jgi:hypothetical protein
LTTISGDIACMLSVLISGSKRLWDDFASSQDSGFTLSFRLRSRTAQVVEDGDVDVARYFVPVLRYYIRVSHCAEKVSGI